MKTLFSLLALVSVSALTAQNSTILPEFIVCTDGHQIHVHMEDAEIQWVNCDTGEEIDGATESEFVTGSNGYFSAIVTIKGRSYQTTCYEVAGYPVALPEVLPASAERPIDNSK